MGHNRRRPGRPTPKKPRTHRDNYKKANDQVNSLGHDIAKAATGKQGVGQFATNAAKKTTKAAGHAVLGLTKEILNSLRATNEQGRKKTRAQNPRRKLDKRNVAAIRAGKQRYRERDKEALENVQRKQRADQEFRAKQQSIRNNKTEPRGYREPDVDENVEICDCHYADTYCYSDGQFEVAEGQYNWYLDTHGEPPVTCGPCRQEAYEILQTEFQKGSCETCGSPVQVNSRLWQQTWRKEKLPTFEMFCHACITNRVQEERRLEIGDLNTADELRSYLDSPTTVKGKFIGDDNKNLLKARLDIRGSCQKLTYVVPDSDIHEYYSNLRVGSHSRLEHIEAHFKGYIERNGKIIPKSAGLGEMFGSPEEAIRYAHQLARRGGYDNVYSRDMGNGKIQYHDLNKGLFITMTKGTPTEPAHVITMFPPEYETDESTTNPQDQKIMRVNNTLNYFATQCRKDNS